MGIFHLHFHCTKPFPGPSISFQTPCFTFTLLPTDLREALYGHGSPFGEGSQLFRTHTYFLSQAPPLHGSVMLGKQPHPLSPGFPIYKIGIE